MNDDTHPRREVPTTDHADPRGPGPRATPDDGPPPLADGGIVPDGGTVADGEVTDGTAGDAESVGKTDGADATPRGPDDSTDDVEKVRRYLLKGALVVLGLLGVVATIQFYSSATSAINILVAEEFQPIFQAAFNLVVLLGVGLGIALVVRELG